MLVAGLEVRVEDAVDTFGRACVWNFQLGRMRVVPVGNEGACLGGLWPLISWILALIWTRQWDCRMQGTRNLV